MAHMNQEKKALISPLIKEISKKYGVKTSLSIRDRSSISLNIKSGNIDFINNFNEIAKTKNAILAANDHVSVNHYWFHEQFSGVALEFLKESMVALKSAGWFDKSDIQIDYFNIAYYISIEIGHFGQLLHATKDRAACPLP